MKFILCPGDLTVGEPKLFLEVKKLPTQNIKLIKTKLKKEKCRDVLMEKKLFLRYYTSNDIKAIKGEDSVNSVVIRNNNTGKFS